MMDVKLEQINQSIEGARKDIWDRPDEDDRMRKRPTSVARMSNSSWFDGLKIDFG
jgi:hypothetical protein